MAVAITLCGCSTTGNADSRGANLSQPDVARNESTGSIAASPTMAQ